MKLTKDLSKSIINLNQLFNHRSRMGIMAILMVNEQVDFVNLRDALQLTDGSLASHLKALAKEELIAIEKKFIKGKPNTSYSATPKGRSAFQDHIAQLEAFVKLGNSEN